MITINIGKQVILSIIAIGVLCGSASAGLRVNVEKKGTYIYWFAYKDGLGASRVTMPARFKGKSADVDTGALGATFKDARLYVMDKRTCNLAITKYAAPKDPKTAKPVDLKSDAFQYVRNVRLRAVSEDGAPLESAIVTLTDGESTEMQAVVSPADEGVASFQDVASGELTVKVKSDGATRTIDSDIELPLKRTTPGFEQDVKVAGDVRTLPVSAVSKPHGGAKPQKATGGASAILQTLAGLRFVVIVIAIFYAVIKAKGVTAEQALRKMGVQLPQDQAGAGAEAAAPAPVVDPTVCEFCGQKKDAAGACACTITSGGVPAAPASTAPATGPRLVGSQGTYSGHVFEIAGDSVTIGREADNPIALVNDTTASRRHATITISGADYTIRDEGSSNGTFVNGARITEQKLMPGDEIQIGGTKFRFEV